MIVCESMSEWGTMIVCESMSEWGTMIVCESMSEWGTPSCPVSVRVCVCQG